MGILGFSKPKWQHSDPQIRLRSIRQLGADKIDIFTQVAIEDPDEIVRKAALSRIGDLKILEEIAAKCLDGSAAKQARQAMELSLFGMALKSPDQPELIERIRDKELLARIAVEADSPDMRITAINRIDDQGLLCKILEQECGRKPAQAAMEKISDESILRHLTENGGSKRIQSMAAQKLGVDNEPSSSQAASTDSSNAASRLAEIARTAQSLAESTSWDLVKTRIAELLREWDHLDSAGKHPDRKAFDDACQHFTERHAAYLASRKEQQKLEDQQKGLFEQCATICETIENLCSRADDAAAASFQKQLLAWPLKDQKAEGEAGALAARFMKSCAAFDQQRKNYSAEQALMAEIEEQIKRAETLLAADLTESGSLLDRIEKRFAARSLTLFDLSPLRQRFDELKSNLDKAVETERIRLNEEGIMARKAIIAGIEELKGSDNYIEADHIFNELKEKWSHLHIVQEPEVTALEELFDSLCKEFLDQQDTFFKEREWQRWHNKTLKEELIQTAEALDTEQDFALAAATIKEAQQRWKEIGPVPQKESDRLWKRFRNACNRNFERCQQFFAELDEQRASNQELKESLCRRAEEAAGSDDWKGAAETIKTLQQEWSSAGPATREHDAELNRNFRKVCNTFFERRRKHFAELDATRRENLAAKAELCRQAETLASAPNFEASREIRGLQNKWKESGQAPRSQEQKAWIRFRAACDRFYAGLDELRRNNLQRKVELCETVEKLIETAKDDDDQSELAHQIGELQKEWKTVGPVPKEESDAIWDRFRKTCDQFFTRRREEFEGQEKERAENQLKKEALLVRAEAVATNEPGTEATAQLQQLQQEWNTIGPATRGSEAELRRRFRSICDSYFKGRREHFQIQEQDRHTNLKQKEILCFRLEQVLGSCKAADLMEYSTLTLAEEFQIARETKFIMSGKEDDQQRKGDEVRRIQEEWKGIGPVPRESAKQLVQRYRALLDTFYGETRQKTPVRNPVRKQKSRPPAAEEE